MVSARQLSIAYAALFAAVGGFGPWLGLVLVKTGQDPADVAVWLALMPATTVVAGPAWAWIADRYRLGTRILTGTTGGAALLGGLLATPLPTPVVPLVLVGLGTMRAGMSLVLDAFTLRSLETQGAEPSTYGRIRRWGSVGYVVGVAVAAVLAEVYMVAPLLLGAAMWALCSAGFATFPRVPASGHPDVLRALWALARTPGVGWLLAALPLYGLGMTAYDAWYAVHVDALGLPAAWTAAAIAAGVVTEVAVMSRATALFARVAPPWVVVAALATCTLRWAAIAVLTDPVALTLVQLTHGLSFGAFWVGSVEWLRRLAPPEIRASAQMALLVLGYGVGPLLTGVVARQVVPDLGTAALFAAGAVAAGVATVLAALGARS